MAIALLALVFAALWRVFTLDTTSLANFAPIMAMAFCSGVYFKRSLQWLAPFAAYVLSDLYVSHYYATVYRYDWTLHETALRVLCFAVGLGLGIAVSRRRSWLNLLSGILGSSVLFYLVTNTAAFIVDPGYAHSAAGWWQAMTVGHPQYPPTLVFFRNTFLSDVLFSGAFVFAMELRAKKVGEPSLLAPSRA
jgi:hypothetical protein